jgi:phage-related protein
MAISGGDGSIILTTKVDETGLKKGLGSMKSMVSVVSKSFAVIGAAAATATVAITKMAVSAYADYEQLVGGVETLFKGSAQKVIDYASDAFYTAGVSANEYMQQVTSFSASLIRSTAGDTDKAADIANMALIDISDNVNKMGSTMESVTLAYQGFAKQQYMLLDNLKLGYGGTKTEMERLLKDAQALTGVKYDINNLADVYSAIHAIQEELSITGTTAKEAEKTISGSLNMVKASWKNLITAIAGGGNLEDAINNFVYSLDKFTANLIPVIEKTLIGLGQAIKKILPQLVQTVVSALIQAIPSLVEAVYNMIIGLFKGLVDGISALFTGQTSKATATIKNNVSNISDDASSAADNMQDVADATSDAEKEANKAIATFDELNILNSPKDNIITEPTINKSENIISSEVTQEGKKQSSIFEEIQEKLSGIADLVKEGFWDGFKNHDFSDLKNDFNSISKSLNEIFLDADVTDAVSNLMESFAYAIGQIGGSIASIGVSIAENLIGGLESFLNEKKDNIKNDLTEMFDVSSEIVSTFGELSFAVATVFSSIGSESGQKFTGSLFGLVYETFSGIVSLALTVGKDIINAIATPIIENQDGLRQVFEGIFASLTPIINGVSDVVRGIFNGVEIFWEKGISPALQYISNAISNAFGGIITIWNTLVSPALENAFSKIGDALSNAFGPAIENLLGSLGNLVNAIFQLFTPIIDAITSIIEGIVAVVGLIVSPIINIIGDLISGIINAFSGLINASAGIFNGIAGMITNIIQGDIMGVLESFGEMVWDFGSGIADAIGSLVEGVVDAIVSAIQGIIDIISTVGEAIGNLFSSSETISGIGMNAPNAQISTYSIPKLAQGAVIPPNREFMAVLGDQKKGTNIEAPLDTIKQAVAEVYRGSTDNININFSGSLSQLARVLNPQISRENRRVGTSLITSGG